VRGPRVDACSAVEAEAAAAACGLLTLVPWLSCAMHFWKPGCGRIRRIRPSVWTHARGKQPTHRTWPGRRRRLWTGLWGMPGTQPP
jgi:hypothetical protein